LRLGEPRLVVAERRTLRQRSADQWCRPLWMTGGKEDERGSRGGPAGEEVEVLGHGKRRLEGAQRLVEVARRLRRDADRAPGGGGPASVPESGGDGQGFAGILHRRGGVVEGGERL